MVASIKQHEDEETKVTSHLWGDLGQSTSNSHMLSYSRLNVNAAGQFPISPKDHYSEPNLKNIGALVDSLTSQPAELKR